MTRRLSILIIVAALLAAVCARAGTVSYTYDTAGRLTGADFGGGRSISLYYDAMGNLTQRVVLGVTPQADVSIAKSSEQAVFESGRGNLVYWLSISNAGPDAASNVRVSDPLPGSTVFAGASTGAVAAGVFEANLGSLAAGALSSVRLELVPLATGVYVNIASVTNDTADTQTVNNIAGFTNTVTRAADTNVNGLADWWENFHFTNAADRVATNDFDHDGVPNIDEQSAGTDPTASNSVLRLDGIDIPSSSCVVSFPTASGRVYAVDAGTNLPMGLWTNLRSNIPGTGAEASVPDTNNTPQSVYRIRASVP